MKAPLESFNNAWQQKVCSRYHHPELDSLPGRADRYIPAYTNPLGRRLESATQRPLFPTGSQTNLRPDFSGRNIHLSRSDDKRTIRLFGHRLHLQPTPSTGRCPASSILRKVSATATDYEDASRPGNRYSKHSNTACRNGSSTQGVGRVVVYSPQTPSGTLIPLPRSAASVAAKSCGLLFRLSVGGNPSQPSGTTSRTSAS